VNLKGKFIAASVIMSGPSSKEFYHALASQKEQVEREIGEPLLWEGSPPAERAALLPWWECRFRRMSRSRRMAGWASGMMRRWLAVMILCAGNEMDASLATNQTKRSRQ
jgi:hypothetical protein